MHSVSGTKDKETRRPPACPPARTMVRPKATTTHSKSPHHLISEEFTLVSRLSPSGLVRARCNSVRSPEIGLPSNDRGTRQYRAYVLSFRPPRGECHRRLRVHASLETAASL